VWVLLNDQIVPEERALVSVFDRGFTYGDGAFETLRVYNGHPFQLGAHLTRFGEAVRALRLPMPRTAEGIAADIRAVLGRNQLNEAVVRFQLSRGRGGRGPGIRDAASPTWVVAAWPLPADLDARVRRGARVSVVTIRRLHPATLPSGAKLANYLNSVLAVVEASETGSDEGLMLTPDGLLAECGAANLFYVRGGELRTPARDLGVLPGVTRQVVLDLAREAGIPASESADPPSVLPEASEAFLTHSVLGLWPVRSIDGRDFSLPGIITSRLQAGYAASIARDRS
jgi:aminodeoxychorismate lyase